MCMQIRSPPPPVCKFHSPAFWSKVLVGSLSVMIIRYAGMVITTPMTMQKLWSSLQLHYGWSSQRFPPDKLFMRANSLVKIGRAQKNVCKYVQICENLCANVYANPKPPVRQFCPPCILIVGCRRLCFVDEYSLCGKGDYHADDYAKTVWSSLQLH